LVGTGVTSQAPSSNNNNNTNNKKNPRTQSQEKSATFNIKQQKVVFLELNCKERKEIVVYVNGGHAIVAVSI
jgi:hypothetical protein